MIELLKTMLPAAMGDALTAQGFPVTGLAAASFAYALNALVPKRMKSAADIWVQIVGRDWGALSEEQEEELASIVDTFLQIARKGTAKANLRLLARIVAGQKAARALKADEFLYYADLLASLSHEEICLLGTLQKHNGIDKPDFRDIAKTAKLVMDELIPSVFASKADFAATSQALTRTGFVIRTVASNYDCDEPCYLTPLFEKVSKLASFQGLYEQSAQ
ncbi:MAG: hypothetical protein PHD48_09950 [Alphaproteobacteria bacterium]|nr:hypothetical protein [Alphaproteobacteria bacterium]